MGHLADENRAGYSLGSYISEIWKDDYKKDFWAKYKTYNLAPRSEALDYVCRDAVYTGKLFNHLQYVLAKDGIPDSLIDHVHRLQSALLRTELLGVRVDQGYLIQQGLKLGTQIERIRPQMRALVGSQVDLIEMGLWEEEIAKRKTPKGKVGVPRPEFSFDSGPMLKKLLYEELGLPVQHNDQTKSVSTDFASLEKLKGLHPIVPLIQEYRELTKIKGTYIDGILERTHEGRIYPTFRLVDDHSGMKTARISHRDPNLGNFPKEGGVKGIFIADDGCVLSEHDYSQLEVCIEAHFTQDKNLIRIIMEGVSKHDITAASLGIERSLAKTVNFAMQYWCGPSKLAKILGVSNADAQLVFNKYWETYAGCKSFKAKVDESLRNGKPIQDLFGRKRRFPGIPSWDGDKAFRQAYNFVIQSTGAQILNNAYYKSCEWLGEGNRGRGLWTVHDSGLFQHFEKYAEESAHQIDQFMVQEGVLCGLTIPLQVVSEVGMHRWGEELHE